MMDTVKAASSLKADRRGGVAIIFALLLPALIGIVALVGEYGAGLLARAQNQRVADMAAYAGALAYSDGNSLDAMNAAARRLAALNGVPPDDVAAALVASPRGSGQQAVAVDIVTTRPLLLAPILGTARTLDVAASAAAELGSGGGPATCLLALDPKGIGIKLEGGTNINAPDCTINSNSRIDVPWGTTMVAQAVTYDSNTPPHQPGSGIKSPNGGPAPITRQYTPDPFAGDKKIADAVALFTQSEVAVEGKFEPIPAGVNVSFEWGDSATTSKQVAPIGCDASRSNSHWTLSCPGRGPFNFGEIKIGGGLTVDFNRNGDRNAVYNFSRDLKIDIPTFTFPSGTFNMKGNFEAGGNSTVSFGDGTFNIQGRFDVSGSGRASFGEGTFNFAQGVSVQGSKTLSFGKGTFDFGKAACGFSICNSATTTFAGPSTFKLANGISNGGNATLTLGAGSANSFTIGPSTSGHAINVAGGSRTVLADATDPKSSFVLNGNVLTGGGSCLTLGAAPRHRIFGSVSAAGGLTLGAGAYIVDGYFALGENNGGSVHCNGKNIGLEARDVSLVLAGKSSPSNGNCRDTALCIGSGFSNDVLVAPKTGPFAGLAVIGPQLSSNKRGATLAQGAQGVRISGLFYFPYGPIVLSGGASLGGAGGGNDCLQIVGSEIRLSGGTATTSDCLGAGGTGTTTNVMLVQ